jgi:hypothetical protein
LLVGLRLASLTPCFSRPLGVISEVAGIITLIASVLAVFTVLRIVILLGSAILILLLVFVVSIQVLHWRMN